MLLGFWLGYCLSARQGAVSASRASGPAHVGGASTEPPSDWSAGSPPSYDPELAVAHVRLLAETIGPRPAGSAQELQAARYLHGYLSGLGYDTRLQGPIPLEGSGHADEENRCTQNVVAFGPSSAPPGPALLIGAHYDSIALREPSPGGNDNGSGVAAMLELARTAADLPLPCPLCFVAFGAEERVDDDPDHHHYGSRYFHAHQAQALAAMVSVDMIGVGEQLHLRYLKPAPEPLLELVEAAASRIGVAVSRKPDPGHSDHEPFARAGLPAVWIQRLEDPANHSSADTAERVKPVYIQSVVSLLAELLASLTCDDLDRIAAYSGG
jgi:hypothetical protein